MSVQDLLFRLKLDPSQFSKSMKDMAKGVDGLSKKRLDTLNNSLKNLGKQSTDIRRKIDLMGEAVTKADRKKMAKLKLELREVEKAAKKAGKEVAEINSATPRAARFGDRVRGFGNRIVGRARGVGSSLGAGAKELGARGLDAIPGGAALAGLGLGGVGLAGGGLLAGGLALGAGAVGLGMFAKGGVAAARDGKRIDTALQHQLEAQGAGDRFKELDALSGTLQKAMNLDDEATREGFTEFLKRGFNVDELKKNASLIGDIAKEKQIDYAAAAELVAKGMSGESRAMRELGLATSGDKVRDAATFQAQAQAKFGGVGAKLAAAEGPGVSAQLAIDDIQQALGAKLLPVIDKLSAKIFGLIEKLNSDGTMDKLIKGAATFITGLIDGVSWVIDAVGGLTTYLQNFNWGDIINGLITWAIEGSVLLFKNLWTLTAAFGKTVWNVITKGLPAIGALILEVVLKLMDRIPGLKTLISDDAIKGAEMARSEAVGEALGAQGDIFGEAGSKIKRDYGQAFSAIGGEGGFNVAGVNGAANMASGAVATANAAKSAQAEVYGMAGFTRAGQEARQDAQYKKEKADAKSSEKMAKELKKTNAGIRQASTMKITSMDGRLNPVGVY